MPAQQRCEPSRYPSSGEDRERPLNSTSSAGRTLPAWVGRAGAAPPEGGGNGGAIRIDIVADAVGRGKLLPVGSLAVCGALIGVLASGCGEATRNARETSGTYTVEIVKARFPAKQAIARDTKLALVVRNSGTATIPNVAVTLDSLSYASKYLHLSANQRPDLDRQYRPRRGVGEAGGKRAGQPARRRGNGVREHMGARCARARREQGVRVEGDTGEGRRAQGSLRRVGGSRRQGARPARRRWVGGRASSSLRSRLRRLPRT